MSRHTLFAALSLLLLFTLLSVAAIAISSAQPTNPALADLSVCESGVLCWFGIEVNVTTQEEATRILLDVGYRPPIGGSHYQAPNGSGLCDIQIHTNNTRNPDLITSMFLTDCGDVQLGDVWILPAHELIRTCEELYLISLENDSVISLNAYPTSLFDQIHGVILGRRRGDLTGNEVDLQGFTLPWTLQHPTRPFPCSDDVE